MAFGSPSGSSLAGARTWGGGSNIGPGAYNIPYTNVQEGQKALIKTYRPEYGIAMTDAEYAAQKQKEAADQRANAPRPAQQHAAPSSAALQGIQSMAGYGGGGSLVDPLTSNYTGAPTSSIEADRKRQELEMEAERYRASLTSQAAKEQFDREQAANASTLQARIAANNADFDKRYAATQSLMNQPLNSDSAAGTASIDPAIEAAARAAAFARAKEQAGQTAHASLRALQDVFAGRGMMGSSAEANAIGGVVGGAAKSVDEYTRDQNMTDLNRAADVADRNYQGNLQKRAQEINMRQSLLAILNQTGGLY